MRDRSKPSPFAGQARGYAFMEPRTASPVVVRRLEAVEPESLINRCVRCGKAIEGDAFANALGAWHEDCRPAPGPAPVIEDSGRRRQLRDVGPRTTHLSDRDRRRVLAWLDENGPATARMAGWALNLPFREVSLTLRTLDADKVETAGVLLTGRRGHPPVVWQIRRAVAA